MDAKMKEKYKRRGGGWGVGFTVALTRVEVSVESLTKFDAPRREKMLKEPRP